MIKVIILNILFISSLFSSNLIINNNENFDSFNLSFYEDKTNKLRISDLKKINSFENIQNNIAKGYKEGSLWYKISITNKTSLYKDYILYINEVYNDEVDFYVVYKNKVYKSYLKGVARLDLSKNIRFEEPKLNIRLEPNDVKDIYIRVSTKVNHTYSIKLLNFQEYKESKILSAIFLSLYFGGIVSLIIYNLFIYFSLKEKMYMLYILFATSYILSQGSILGYFPFNFLPSENMAHLSSTFNPLWLFFHILFSREILNTSFYMPKIDRFLKYLAFSLILVCIINLYDINLGIPIFGLLMLISLPLIFIFSFFIHFRGNKVALFFIISQLFFIGSNLIYGFLTLGLLEYNNITRYASFYGSYLEIVLFSFLLVYKTRLIVNENEKQKELVYEYSKLSFLGQTIINIYHQWKSPVNNIYNSINHIETAKEFQDKNLNKIVEENLDEIKHNTLYLRETASSYLNYYKGIDKPKSKFNLKDEIALILKLHKQEFDKLKIQVDLFCDDELNVFLQKNIFTNIVIILIENSINVFKQREIKNPELKILINKRENKIDMIFCDNAGGIKIKNCDDIFKKNHSISDSTGLGLFLIKDFLCPKINANIKAKNIKDGACFELSIVFSS